MGKTWEMYVNPSHTIVPPSGTKPAAAWFNDFSAKARLMEHGLQALASDAAARIGELAARAPAWTIDLAASVLAIVAALACHAILMSLARRDGAKAHERPPPVDSHRCHGAPEDGAKWAKLGKST